MMDLRNRYEELKIEANILMNNGEITGYFNTLLEMNKYKKLMFVSIAN